MSTPMFKHVIDGGKYVHPWFKALPKSREQAYDFMYKATSTVLFGGAVYGMFEVARGCYFIMAANHGSSPAVKSSTPTSPSSSTPSQ